MPGKSRALQRLEAEELLASPDASDPTGPRYYKILDRRAADYALLGATNDEIADLLHINIATFEKWQREHASFAKAVRSGREDANARVVRSLHAAAVGYKHKETKLNVVDGKLKKTVVTKAYPPNVNAAALILTNRDPKRWRDAKTVQHTGQINLSALVESSLGDSAKPVEAQPLKDDAEE